MSAWTYCLQDGKAGKKIVPPVLESYAGRCYGRRRGFLTVYRWSGEKTLLESNIVMSVSRH
jgi:hypothetical protein